MARVTAVRSQFCHGLRVSRRAIVVENKWRAQRYGVHGTFVDISGNGAISVADLLEQVLDDVRRDAEVLDCVEEIEHCRSIVGSGTSADTQLALFEKAQGGSDNRDHALRAVTDWLAEATLQ